MALWEVRTAAGMVVVEADHWLSAVTVSSDRLGLDVHAGGSLAAEVRDNGVVRVQDRGTGARLLLRQVPMAALDDEDDLGAEDLATVETEEAPLPVFTPASPTIVPLHEFVEPSGPATLSDEDEPTDQLPRAVGVPLPQLAPVASFSQDDLQTLLDPAELEEEPEPTSDLLEALFLGGEAIAAARTVEDAAAAALELLLGHVGARAGAVLYAGLDDTGLRFIAAHGDDARERLGTELPFGSGVAGHVFDSGRALLLLGGAGAPTRTLQEHTASRSGVVAVPVRDDRGHTFGVIELVDPDPAGPGFVRAHLHAAELVALTLAQSLDARTPR